jgi:hypothetical protein
VARFSTSMLAWAISLLVYVWMLVVLAAWVPAKWVAAAWAAAVEALAVKSLTVEVRILGCNWQALRCQKL